MIGLIVFLVLGYGIGACLMMAFWSRIPPQSFFTEFVLGVTWPLFLLVMIPAAFISATIRALSDHDGQFAGIYKDSGWMRERMNKKNP